MKKLITTLLTIIAININIHAQSSWDGGSTTSSSWGNATNWVGNVVPTFNSSANLLFNNLTRPDNDLGGSRTVGSINYGANMDGDFVSNFRSFNGGTATSLTLQAASGNASIMVDADATGNLNLGWNGIGTAGGALILGSNLDIIHNGSGNLIFSRQITGTNGFTKTGTGTMIVANFNTNSFTGAANFNGGRAIFGNTATPNNDLNSASAVNLGGGTLEIRTASANNKALTPNMTVSAASTLLYNNTAVTDQSFTVSTGSMVLNANLRLQNISSSTNGNNIFNITRNLTGNGSLVADTYNNVSSGAVAFSNGRIQLSGDNSQWNGDLIVSKGTAQYSGALSYAGNGGITIGAMGDVFGAGLGFNSAFSDINLTKAITVSTGGTRLIRNNSGPGSLNNITLGGPITLNGNLTIDHAGLGADKVITVSGNVSGDGGLNVTFDGPHPIVNSSVQLSGNNSYTGATVIGTGAVLVVDTTGSIASSATTVTGGTLRVKGTAGDVLVNTGGTLGGSGSVQGLTLNGGIVAPGNSPGLLSAYELNGSNGTFQFQLGAPTTRGITYDAINVTSLLTLGANTNFTFEVLDNYNFSNGDSYDLFDFGSIDATNFDVSVIQNALPSLANTPDLSWNVSQFTLDGSVSVSIIPEPTTLDLLTLPIKAYKSLYKMQLQFSIINPEASASLIGVIY
jgi:autotransporter-associated beta strand protein